MTYKHTQKAPPLKRKKAKHKTHAARAAEEKPAGFEKALAEIRNIQKEVRSLGLVENMLTDDDLYDENGLPK